MTDGELLQVLRLISEANKATNEAARALLDAVNDIEGRLSSLEYQLIDDGR